jgi:hypothetical protein
LWPPKVRLTIINKKDNGHDWFYLGENKRGKKTYRCRNCKILGAQLKEYPDFVLVKHMDDDWRVLYCNIFEKKKKC